MIYLELFLGFLEVGLFSFGGAYAAIPLIRDVVLSYGWLTDEMISYMIAVSESTPGPIMVNLATYVGSSQAGLPGAVIATGAVILPAIVIILVIVRILKKFIRNPYVKAVMDGLKSCVIGIILATGIFMLGNNLSKAAQDTAMLLKSIGLAAGLLFLLYGGEKIFRKKISPILLIAVSAGAGILIF